MTSIFKSLLLSLAAAAGALEPSAQNIVTFRPGTERAVRLDALASSGAVVVRELDLINAVVVKTPEASAAWTGMLARPEVLRVEPDRYVDWLQAVSAPELPAAFGAAQAALRAARQALSAATPTPPAPPEIPWGILRVNAPAAWPVSRGEGVRVAVVDTGIDATHPLLPNVAGGYNAIDPRKSFHDDNEHGTHVSGTIGGAYPYGVAPKAKLYGVKVLDDRGYAMYSWIVAGIQWAVKEKAQIINLSLGTREHVPSLEAAVKAAAERGILVVCAAGNDNSGVGFPAVYAGAVAVSALDEDGKSLATFSNWGPQIAFAAPGARVESSIPGGGRAKFSGTSMAAPHVVGLAALKLAQDPTLSLEGLKSALARGAVRLNNLTREMQGAGVIDAAKLISGN